MTILYLDIYTRTEGNDFINSGIKTMQESKFIGLFEDRFKHPIFGAFTFSWFLINYEFILKFFASSQGPEERIKLINDTDFHIFIPLTIGIAFPVLILIADLFLQVLRTFSINLKSVIRKKLKETDVDLKYEKYIHEIQSSNKKVKNDLETINETAKEMLTISSSLESLVNDINEYFNANEYDKSRAKLNALSLQIHALNSINLSYEVKELEKLLNDMNETGMS